MADTSKKVIVQNRSNGSVVYQIPELNIRRTFAPKESKPIATTELDALSQTDAGMVMLQHFLFVQDKELIEQITNEPTEPEYWLKEADIPNWMNSCSDDEFIDCLNFAPDGVKDLIKKYAVEVPLRDANKREAVKKMLGFDVDKAIVNDAASKEDTEPARSAPTRRVSTEQSSIKQPAANTTPATPARKATPNYKIVDKK